MMAGILELSTGLFPFQQLNHYDCLSPRSPVTPLARVSCAFPSPHLCQAVSVLWILIANLLLRQEEHFKDGEVRIGCKFRARKVWMVVG
jgi:hypothetical protein